MSTPRPALDALTRALLKRLANSHDPADRAKSVRVVGHWMRTRKELQEDELLKIWRGLFYCFWMSDKVPVQQELAANLADLLLPPMPLARSQLVLGAFLHTLQREWTSIDQLRMDKFMTLVRRFVHRGFLAVAKAGWPQENVEALTLLYLEPSGAPLAHDTAARGFFLHVTDTFLTELERAAADSSRGARAATLPFEAVHTLLTPFVHALALCRDPSMVERVQKEVWEPLLELCKPAPAGGAQAGQQKQKQSKSKRAEKDSEDEDEDMDDSEQDEEEDEETAEEEDGGLAAQFPFLHSVLQGHSNDLASTLFALAGEEDPSIVPRSRKLLYRYAALFAAVEGEAARQEEEDEGAAQALAAEKAAAKQIAAQRKASAKAAAKQQGNRKRKADDASLDGASIDELEPGVGSEGLSVAVAERAKKRNKKQRLADKRRKAAAILGAEPGQASSNAQHQSGGEDDGGEEEEQQHAFSNGNDDDDDEDDGAEQSFAPEGDSEDEEAAAFADGALALDSDDDDDIAEDEDDDMGGGEDEAEEDNVSELPLPRVSAKEAKRLAQALQQAQAAKQQQQQGKKSKKKIVPVHEPATPTPAATASPSRSSPSLSPSTPPSKKAPAARGKNAPTLIADPSIASTHSAASTTAAFHTPQPAKKSALANGTGAATTARASVAPPSSTKKSVQIVLANNQERVFKRFSRDSVSVPTPSLLARPSPRSAIKPDSIAFFLQHNKNGRELAARQQALKAQFNDAANTPKKGTRNTPPVSPRHKAADFF